MIPSYHLLVRFAHDFPNREFFFILGSDLLPDLEKWTYGAEFVDSCNFCILKRKGYPCSADLFPKRHEFWPEFEGRELSSTQIREYIQAETKKGERLEEKEVLKMTTDDVYKFIMEDSLYQKVA